MDVAKRRRGMSMRTDWYTKAVLTVIAGCLLWLCVFDVGGIDVQAQTTVYTDQQLLTLARDTWQRATTATGTTRSSESDYMYAALHMYALLQRNPAVLQNDPAFAKQFAEGQAFAGRRIQAWLKIAEQAPVQVREAAAKDLGALP